MVSVTSFFWNICTWNDFRLRFSAGIGLDWISLLAKLCRSQWLGYAARASALFAATAGRDESIHFLEGSFRSVRSPVQVIAEEKHSNEKAVLFCYNSALWVA